LSKEERLIVDQCLEFNFKVYNAFITDWENQKKRLQKKVKKIQIEDLLGQPIVPEAHIQTPKDKTILITVMGS
jgi:undecaprenyl pyrophosphate synthase